MRGGGLGGGGAGRLMGLMGRVDGGLLERRLGAITNAVAGRPGCIPQHVPGPERDAGLIGGLLFRFLRGLSFDGCFAQPGERFDDGSVSFHGC